MTTSDTITLITLAAAYLGAGLTSAWGYGQWVWGSDYARLQLKTVRYHHLAAEVRSTQKMLIFLWPPMLIKHFITLFLERLARSGDPHVRHQAEYAKAVKDYNELVKLEQQAGVPAEDKTAIAPEVFCHCLPQAVRNRGSNSQRPVADVQIQHRVELINKDLARDFLTRESMEGRIAEHTAEIEYYLRQKGMWQG